MPTGEDDVKEVESALGTLEKLTVLALSALLVAAQAALAQQQELHFENFTVKSALAGMVLFGIISGVNLQVIVLLQLIRRRLGPDEPRDLEVHGLLRNAWSAEDPWTSVVAWFRQAVAPQFSSRADKIRERSDKVQTTLRQSRWIFNPFLETGQRLGFFTDTIGIVALMLLWSFGIYMGRYFSPALTIPAPIVRSETGAPLVRSPQCEDQYALALASGYVLSGATPKSTAESATSTAKGSSSTTLIPLSRERADKAGREYVGVNREVLIAALRQQFLEGAKSGRVPNDDLRKLYRDTLKGCPRAFETPPDDGSQRIEILGNLIFCGYLLTVLVATSLILLSLRDVIGNDRLLRIKAGIVGAGLVTMMMLGLYVGGQIADGSPAHADFPVTLKQDSGPSSSFVLPPTMSDTTGTTTTSTDPPPPPPAQSEDANAKLIRAILRGRSDEVDEALREHAHPAARDAAGRPAIVLAAQLQEPQIAATLIRKLKEFEVPLSSQRDADRTALQAAAERGSAGTLLTIAKADEWSEEARAEALVAAYQRGLEVNDIARPTQQTRCDRKCAAVFVALHAPQLLSRLDFIAALRSSDVLDLTDETSKQRIAAVWLQGHGHQLTPETVAAMIAARNTKLPVEDELQLMFIGRPELKTLPPINGQPPLMQAARRCDAQLFAKLPTVEVTNNQGETPQKYYDRYCGSKR